jgi:hypothetical protein
LDGCHVAPFDGCHVAPFDGCHVAPFDGCHVAPFDGCHVAPFDGCHVAPFDGCHVAPDSTRPACPNRSSRIMLVCTHGDGAAQVHTDCLPAPHPRLAIRSAPPASAAQWLTCVLRPLGCRHSSAETMAPLTPRGRRDSALSGREVLTRRLLAAQHAGPATRALHAVHAGTADAARPGRGVARADAQGRMPIVLPCCPRLPCCPGPAVLACCHGTSRPSLKA